MTFFDFDFLSLGVQPSDGKFYSGCFCVRNYMSFAKDFF